MRRLLLLTFLIATAAQAQTPPDVPRERQDPRRNQKIERTVIEDDSARIEELKVGGQTEKVTVQPKASALPAYEIEPVHLSRSRPGDSREGLSGTSGKRFWNVLSF